MTRLRSDAQENRERILTAAQELLARDGLDVGMREIARRAGVGPATLYRRFPTRDALLEEAFAEQMRTCRRIVEAGSMASDAWEGFASILRQLIEVNSHSRGFVDAFSTADSKSGTLATHRRELLSTIDDVADRARRDGRLRQDFTLSDLLMLLSTGRTIATFPEARRARAAERFATLALDALSAR